jgi:hypothetical protein
LREGNEREAELRRSEAERLRQHMEAMEANQRKAQEDAARQKRIDGYLDFAIKLIPIAMPHVGQALASLSRAFNAAS